MGKNQDISMYDDFGLTAEQASKVKDYVPGFNLGKMKPGTTAKFKLVDDKPQVIVYKDKETQEEKEGRIVHAIDALNGVKVALWLSSTSLRMEFLKLAQRHGGHLKDLNIVIAVREYEHERYGPTRAYTVQEDALPASF